MRLGTRGASSGCSKQKQKKNRTRLCKGKRSPEPHVPLKNALQACGSEGRGGWRGTEEGSPHQAGHIRPQPGWWESLVPPLCHRLCQQSSNVYTAWLASVLAMEVLAGWNARPCWGSETSSDEAFSCLPSCLPRPRWMRLEPGQHRTGKTWGYWPRPLLPWPKHVTHSWQEPGAWPGLHFSGDECFSRPWFSDHCALCPKGMELILFLGF